MSTEPLLEDNNNVKSETTLCAPCSLLKVGVWTLLTLMTATIAVEAALLADSNSKLVAH